MLCSTRSVSGKCQQQKPQQQPEAFAEVVDGKKSFFLFPKICDFIVHELNRSASVFHATGAYSGQDKAIVLTALNRTQAVRLRNFIKITDPKAFILISNTSEIIGKGFHSI